MRNPSSSICWIKRSWGTVASHFPQQPALSLGGSDTFPPGCGGRGGSHCPGNPLPSRPRPHTDGLRAIPAMKQFRRAPLPSPPVPRTWRRVVASARVGFASAEMKRHGRMATIVLVERVEIFPPQNQTQCVS